MWQSITQAKNAYMGSQLEVSNKSKGRRRIKPVTIEEIDSVISAYNQSGLGKEYSIGSPKQASNEPTFSSR